MLVSTHPLRHWQRSILCCSYRFLYCCGREKRSESGKGRLKTTLIYNYRSLAFNDLGLSDSLFFTTAISSSRYLPDTGRYKRGLLLECRLVLCCSFPVPHVLNLGPEFELKIQLLWKTRIMATSMSTDDPQLKQIYRDFISGSHILHYHRYCLSKVLLQRSS